MHAKIISRIKKDDRIGNRILNEVSVCVNEIKNGEHNKKTVFRR